MSFDWLAAAKQSTARRDRHRLFDIRSGEVSLVDRAANRRRLLAVKREGVMPKPKTSAKPKINDDDIDFGNEFGDDNVDFGGDPSSVRRGVAKAGAISPVLKSGLLHTLTEGVERAMSLADIVRGATVVTEKSDSPLPAIIGNELRSIEGVLGTISTMAKIGDCPGGFVKDPKSGKCMPPMSKTQKADADKRDCPDGQLWCPEMGKCVPESMMKKSDVVISADVKKRLLADLSQTIQKAMDLRNVLQGATEADAGTVIPADVGLHMRGIALGLGQSVGRFASPAAKAFVLVDAESSPTALAKAGAALTLTAEQQGQVSARLEKAIDGLSEAMMGLDRTAEHDEAEAEVPGFVSAAAETAIGSLRGLSGLVAKAEGDEDEDDAGDGADQGGDGDAGAAAGGDQGDQGAGDAGDQGGDGAGDAGDGGSDAGDAGDGGDAGAGDQTDIAKAIADGLSAAMKPFAEGINKRLDAIEAEGKHTAEIAKRAAGTTPPPNAEEPGQRSDVSKAKGGEGEESFGDGWAGESEDDWGNDAGTTPDDGAPAEDKFSFID
jgi:hypothetical protein